MPLSVAMFTPETHELLFSTLEILVYTFVFIIGLGVLAVVIIFIFDVTQQTHAIRRNFPVIGHFRALFEHLGVFFRQYFFAMDREEMPFNRAERTWIYNASKNLDSTVAFGSTRDLKPAGTVYFVNCPFPTLGHDQAESRPLTIGADCKQPYTTSSLFNISGMSYGAISKPAILALSNGARMAGSWMNTGEGGLSPYHLEGGADIVFQIGTAKYGVRNNNGELDDDRLREVASHEQVRMFEIKLSQGAKPGKGGILPGVKVSKEISEIRGIPIHQDSISPNRHPDIDSVNDLLNMIHRVRNVTGKPVGIKMVIGAYGWLDDLFSEINNMGSEYAPDFITIDGGEGGTGAAPMSLIDSMGLPIREALPRVDDKLCEHNLKERIKIIASGKLTTPTEMAWALCAGADFIVSARGFMFALGCIQALQCNKDTCPTGITTHNKRLQKGLAPKTKAKRVHHYIKNIVHEVGTIAHSCGVNEPRKLRRFHARVSLGNGKSAGLDEIFPEYNSVNKN